MNRFETAPTVAELSEHYDFHPALTAIVADMCEVGPLDYPVLEAAMADYDAAPAARRAIRLMVA